MKLTNQQQIIAAVIALIFLIAIVVMASIKPDTSHVDKAKSLMLSTSTPKSDVTTTGWWDAMPTAPSLPTMPSDSSPTPTDVP